MDNNLENLCKNSLSVIAECKQKVCSYVKELNLEGLDITIYRQCDEIYEESKLIAIKNGVFQFFVEGIGIIEEEAELLSLNELYDIISYIQYKYFSN